MKMKKTYIAVIMLVVIVGGYFWYKKSNSSDTIPVYKTAVAEKGAITSSISGSGNVIVDQLSTVDPTITGTVSNLSVEVGDTVKKGQLLFTIINEDLSVANARAAASLQQAKNSVGSAELQVEQARDAYEAEQRDLDQKENLGEQLKIAKDQLLAAQKSYSATLADHNNQLSDASKRTVKAPIDGTVNAVNIKNGDDLSRLSSSSASQAPIIIGDLDTLKAEVQVNEIDIPNISVGQKVMFQFSAIDDLELSGKVEKIDALGVVTSGVVTYDVTIGFDVSDPRIRPQMSVSASIITAVKPDVIIIPSGAVKTENESSYVEVLAEREKVPVRKNVVIGISDNINTEIVSGIEPGDKVVTQTINSGVSGASTASGQSGGVRIPGVGGFGR